MADDNVLYQSPTLAMLRALADMQPINEPEAACTDCPGSIWYKLKDDDLTCHCTVLHKVMWDGRMDPVELCDGREQELAAHAARQKRSD